MGYHGRNVLRPATYFLQRGGHTQSAEEVPQTADASLRRALRMGEIHFTTEYVDGEPGKTHDIMAADIFHPGGHHHRKPRAVGAVIEGGQLVFNLVAGPVLIPADAAGIVVGQHSRPHEVRMGGVVTVIRQRLGGGVHNGFHHGLAQPVGEGYVRRVGEIALAQVGQHIHRTAGQLIIRQRIGVGGVQHGEFGPDEVRFGAAPFQIAVLLRDDAAVGAFAAGGGDGQHRANRKRMFNFGFSGEEIPEIAVIGDAHADGLGGVDDAAAADGQQEICPLCPSELDTFIHLAAAGIGLNAP